MIVSTTLRPLYPRKRKPVPTLQETGWASEPVWIGPKNVTLTGFRTSDSPTRSDYSTNINKGFKERIKQSACLFFVTDIYKVFEVT